MKRYIHDFNIAVDSLLDNKLKSILTGLGIIFGVAAVISMLAIGRGAKEEILEQIKLVGVNNIVISPIVEPEDEDTETNGNGNNEKKKFSPGLTMQDLYAIKNNIKTVKHISPELEFNSYVIQNGVRENAKIIGVSEEYFTMYNLQLSEGKLFSNYHEENGVPVCIIGSNIRAKFFSKVNPIDHYIKCGKIWLKVIGVLERSDVSLTGFENAGINVYNDNIYIPIKTMLMRYQNRGLFTQPKIQTAMMARGRRRRAQISVTPTQNTTKNYHQLDKITVQVLNSEYMSPTAEILSRMFYRKHMQVKDYEIRLPEQELKMEQRNKDIFNIVLGCIAGIALIVGGIGIMNIMFASVMERIKEIGTRLAIGAKKTDIVVQFLSEAVLISVIGGLIGVVLGVALAKTIEQIFDIKTIVTLTSVLIAFGVSATIGIIFGYSPAKRASEKDPIESLRHE